MAYGAALILLWITVAKGSPGCYHTLTTVACREHYLRNPETLPQFCDFIRDNCNPPLTCLDIFRCNPTVCSGYYQIQAANGSLVQVYCDMEGTNCGEEGGWMRVLRLDVTDPSSQCPPGFNLTIQNSIRFCVRFNTSAGCTGINIDNFGHNFTQVCGFARGYTYSTPDAFAATGRSSSEPLSGNYVDGVSITYGTPPNHLWTYTAGYPEDAGSNVPTSCPCNTHSASNKVPSYVGNDYYCEASFSGNAHATWYTEDALWDGMRCGGTEGPCCNSTSLPWFNKKIQSPTDDDILVRVCMDESHYEDIGLEQLEIYVK